MLKWKRSNLWVVLRAGWRKDRKGIGQIRSSKRRISRIGNSELRKACIFNSCFIDKIKNLGIDKAFE